MPLTPFQLGIARTIAPNRTEDSHLAGGAALHFSPRGKRFSNDLDYFNDSVERLATAFTLDHETLKAAGYNVNIELSQPGYIRAAVAKGDEVTKLEWAHDSAWRFMPAVRSEDVGYILHEIDLAVNKTLALAGRDEPRDFLDVLYIHEEILSLGALCWAAVGKDPGFSPLSLLELIRRRGKYRPEEFERLRLTKPVDLKLLKQRWLAAIEEANEFIRHQGGQEPGCLFYSTERKQFIAPHGPDEKILKHFGAPGGVLPRVIE